MIKSRNDFINKIHLIISILIVVPAAIIYGFKPDFILDIQLNTVDEYNFFKAVMGFYFGFSFLWVLGLINKKFLRIAIITNLIFMLGLGIGRISSLIFDGLPSFVYLIGTLGEIVLGLYGVWVLNRKNI